MLRHRGPRRRPAPRIDTAAPRIRWLGAIVGVAAAMVAAGAAANAASPELVRDLDPRGLSSDPRLLGVAGDTLYLLADDGVHGVEPWVTDGTSGGTRLVRDLRPGAASSAVGEAVTVGERLFFTLSGRRSDTLWVTDGTAVGTTLLGSDRRALARGSRWYPVMLTAVGDKLYFVSEDAIWVSDGTPAGTGPLGGDVGDPAKRKKWYPQMLTAVGDELSFVSDGSVWFTDGTAKGTTERLAYPEWDVGPLIELGDGLAFATNGSAVWRSDGTRQGSEVLVDLLLRPGSCCADQLTEVGSRLYFVTLDDSAVWSLWTSDGTPAGTGVVQTFRPRGEIARAPAQLTAVGDRLYLVADDGAHGAELWTSDGTAAGTRLVRDIRPGGAAGLADRESRLTVVGDSVFFFADDGVHGSEPWVSDGTAEGTVLVRDLWTTAEPQATARPEQPWAAEVGGAVLFAAEGDTVGRELWRSDGTPEGTHLVRDIRPGARPGGIMNLTPVGSSLYLVAHAEGSEEAVLWRSDARTGDLERLLEVYGGSSATSPPYSLTAVDGSLYLFVADHMENRTRLYRSDGTRAGTSAVPGWRGSDYSACTKGVAFRGMLIAGCSSDPFGRRSGGLLRSDGTRAGTRYLLPFRATSKSTQRIAREFVISGGTLYFLDERFRFTGRRGDARSIPPAELWRSDGTVRGTRSIASIEPAAVSFVVHWAPQPVERPGGSRRLVAFRHGLAFAAGDPAHGQELWVSDGSNGGTRMLADIRPGSAGSGPQGFTPIDDGRLLFSANDGAHGRELWVTDGTAEGTRIVLDLRGGLLGSDPSPVVRAGGRLLFSASDGHHGRELWVTDGTPRGTRLVRDIDPGPASSSPGLLTDVAGRLYFRATDEAGTELWRSRGTRATTRRVADLRPGRDGSDPGSLTDVAGSLYFLADDGRHGRELWRLQP